MWSTEQHIGELGKFGGCDSSKPYVPAAKMPQVALDLPAWDSRAGLNLARPPANPRLDLCGAHS